MAIPHPCRTDLLPRLRKALEENEFVDATFLVGEDEAEFSAHQLILACCSPVFKAMFYGPLRGKAIEPIRIPDIEPGAFRIMIRFMYQEELSFSCAISAFEVIRAADKYMIPKLKSLAEFHILTLLTVETSLDILMAAEREELLYTKQRCLDYISSNASQVFLREEFVSISAQTIHNILSISDLKITDIDLLKAIIRWGMTNGAHFHENTKELLSHVHFKGIGVGDFCEFLDQYPNFLADSDALSIVKHLLNPTKHALPEWCSVDPPRAVSCVNAPVGDSHRLVVKQKSDTRKILNKAKIIRKNRFI